MPTLNKKYIKVTGKKGFDTFIFNNKYLYSQYDPQKEAQKFVDSKPDLKKRVLTVCGAEFVNRHLLASGKTVISFTPEVFENRIISTDIVYFNNTNDLEKYIMNNNIHAADISILLWNELIRTDYEYYAPLIDRIKNILYKSSFSINTAGVFDRLEKRNGTVNKNKFKKIKFLNKSSRKTNNAALICSSGVSLGYNSDFIKNIAGKMTVFALPSAVKYLESISIHPDYIIITDPGYGSLYHIYQLLVPHKIIAPLSISPVITSLDNMDFYFFDYQNALVESLPVSNDIVSTPAEGTVFNNALRVVAQTGFSSAVICGQDFGYDGGVAHIKGGSFEDEFIGRSDYFKPLETSVYLLDHRNPAETIKTDDGRLFKTDIPFKLYLDHFMKTDFGLEIFRCPVNINPMTDKIPVFNQEIPVIRSKYFPDYSTIETEV